MSAASDENKDNGGTKTSEEEENRGVKRAADKSELNVHTANDWEHAKLDGGDERKLKFLRLMGAAKPKEHSGKVTIGENEGTKQHGRSDKEEQELKSKLEKQFESNLEYKLTGGARKHKGLGFHHEEDKDTEEKEKETTNSEKPKADSSSHKEHEAKTKDTEEAIEKEKEEEKPSEEEKKTDGAKSKFSMSFVKASS